MRFAIIISILFSCLINSNSAHSDILIVHFNVNQGDSTLIRDTTSKKSLLVDAGNRTYGKKVIAPYQKNLNLYTIDYFLATHYDSDHIGGFDELVNAGITFKMVLDRGDKLTHRKPKTKKNNLTQFGAYIEAAGNDRKQITDLSCLPSNSYIALGNDTSVEIVACAGMYLKKDCSVGKLKIPKHRDNDLSIALVIRHHDFDCFFGGDLTGGGYSSVDMESLIAPIVGEIDLAQSQRTFS